MMFVTQELLDTLMTVSEGHKARAAELETENTSLRAQIQTLEEALLGLVKKWRAEAFTERRVSFCADELEAALAASRGREPEGT